MSRAERIWAIAVAATALAHRDVRADDVPEAIMICTHDSCEAIVPVMHGPMLLCVDDKVLALPAGAAAPALVDAQGKATPMQHGAARWCATTSSNPARLTIHAGARSVGVHVGSLPMLSAEPGDKGFTYFELNGQAIPELEGALIPLKEVIRLPGTGALTPFKLPMPFDDTKALKEPVAEPQGEPIAPATPRPQLVDEPDDLAFFDVVAVGDDDGAHCTGIAIAKDIVLTAAHCVPATHVDLAINTNKALRSSRVHSATKHPTLDAALLRLEQPLPIVTRARRRAADVSAPHGLVRLVGFGVDDPVTASGFGIKRRADASVSSWGCDLGRSVSTGCVPDAEMVIAAIAGRDTCWGDSGGPVLEPFGDSWRLVAITSRPTLHAGSACGRGGIYVRVDVLDAWISESLKETP